MTKTLARKQLTGQRRARVKAVDKVSSHREVQRDELRAYLW